MRPELQFPREAERSGVIFHKIVMKLVRGGFIKTFTEIAQCVPWQSGCSGLKLKD